MRLQRLVFDLNAAVELIPASLKALGAAQVLDEASTFAKLVQWYDGYRFHHAAEPVFNPVSVGKCLNTRQFDPYWFETGTPSFLLKLIENDPVAVDDIEISQTAFSVYEPDAPEMMAIFYQTGYLTIKSVRQDGAREFSHLPTREHASLQTQMVEALRHDDVNDMLDALSCFFANIPASITVKREKYYQTLFYAVFILNALPA